ncbi:hypothetical protein BCR32DRAFT_251591 [Anaeromyces robustus]|uniref:Uncharacterized protein n=1 Tax=Anaeromyces robustus TaxID=1754192 RepID=A0A1Y1VRM5_9FUNG|nr:hypothetical protein BCR32DRAFT_251591 [Anaeromyces robustus]|eukprot:ORX63414.1 hypothetical protein BCR32DRAFT_251591 [Anaeromyces robustus]
MIDKILKLCVKFNEYANENDLNINVSFNYFSLQENDVRLDSSSIRKKYDIFLYDSRYLKLLSPYLEELEYYLSEEHLKMYLTEDIKKLTVNNGHMLSLLRYELIDTAKYIIKEEENVDLIGYNGLFPEESDTSIDSLYQFLYSYRETKDSPIPEFTSENAKEALNKIKEIKDKISSNEMFNSDEEYTLNTENTLKYIDDYSQEYSLKLDEEPTTNDTNSTAIRLGFIMFITIVFYYFNYFM